MHKLVTKNNEDDECSTSGRQTFPLARSTSCQRTDYWVSQGRKFCEFCKCSIADNKPSIQFHENGRKHKENVAKRLTEMQKKASKEAKDALNFDKEMKKIEAAALKAYAKDVSSDGDFTSQLIKSGLESLPVPEVPEPETKAAHSKKPASSKPPETSHKWREALSEDGQRYYWNFETGESVWEPPKEGFLPLGKSQGKPKGNNPNHRKPKKGKHPENKIKVQVKKEKEVAKEPEPIPFFRGHPYGKWKKVETKEPKPVDLQLPQQEFIPVSVPKLKDDREKKFQEKVFSPTTVSTNTTEQIVFKKRKNASESKRNMRQRLNDD